MRPFRTLAACAATLAASVALVSAAGCKGPPRPPDAGLDAGRAYGNGNADAGDAATAALDAGLPDDTASPPATADLTARGRHLLEAIAQDSPELASDILFPRDAFAANHEAIDPAKAWEKAVAIPFRRAVRLQHRRLRGVERAQFVSLELGQAIGQVTPKKKEWKRPLWRVRHSKLTVTIDGKTHRIEIAEMLGYRGSWYVSKLR